MHKGTNMLIIVSIQVSLEREICTEIKIKIKTPVRFWEGAGGRREQSRDRSG